MQQRGYSDSFFGLIQLTRWKEYIPFVIPLTLLGALLAARPHGIHLDLRLAAVTIANILAVAYAFMINDIEDAPDDARDPARAARNPITSGRISARVGYTACRLVAAITLILYALGGVWVLLIGVVTILLSHLYSWRPVRLKAWPVTDILSHSLMLSGLLLLAGYFLYDSSPGIVWFVALAATLVSVYGQLYNQLRDYDMDRAAGLFNTAIVLGEVNTKRAMYLAIGLALTCLIAAAVQGVFPLWLGLVVLVSIPISMFFRTKTDMRGGGGVVVDASGAMQLQSLVMLNIIIAAWMIESLYIQTFLG
ncbi:MAG: UbiA family prenyltransferase [Anaerolineae bacterium]|nr:UbiA family prenyltransferase [Anaerolineae bacterium]NUQ02664.1 UbiA family prenyltransferase [Anaerolineae bacterium]